MSGTFEKRFRRRLGAPNKSGCIEWLGWKNNRGYGMMMSGDKPWRHLLAHRVSYELHYGLIPQGMKVLHKCDHPSCVNWEHLFLGTSADNTHDMIEKGRQRRSSLDFERVRDLRASGMTQNEIAMYFGVSRPLISMILSGRIARSASQQIQELFSNG